MRLTKRLFDSLILRQNSRTRHSVIIPLDKNDGMQEEFAKFKSFVSNECPFIEEQIIQCPEQLHITFCSFNTSNDYEVLKSRVLLRHCFEKNIKPLLNDKPLMVEIKGLDVWPGFSKNAHILYAKVNDPTNKLQTIANSIANQFNEFRALNNSEYEKQTDIKLHVTLMNTEYPQRIAFNYMKKLCEWNRLRNNGFQDYGVFDDYKSPKRRPFDATKILDKYSDHLFSELIIRNIVFNQSVNGFNALESIQLKHEL